MVGSVNFAKHDTRTNYNLDYNTNLYCDWFFRYCLVEFFKHRSKLKANALLFNSSFSISFTLLVIWHIFLLEYCPYPSYVHCLYMCLVLLRKVLVLVANIGCLCILNFVQYHNYEFAVFFKKTDMAFLPYILPQLFCVLLFGLFVCSAVFGVIACSFTLKSGLSALG